MAFGLFASASTQTVFAADCTGYQCSEVAESDCWLVRETVCSGSAWQYPSQTTVGSCTIKIDGNLGSRQVCWDGTENIIGQCIRPGNSEGVYRYNSVITVTSNCFPDGIGW
jgi:hypothetical protein